MKNTRPNPIDDPFLRSDGENITKNEMVQMKERYIHLQNSTFPGKEVIKSHFFGSDKIKQLLDEKDSVGIRIYYGVDDNNKDTLMLVAVRSDWSDILPDVKHPGVIILDLSKRCPPYC